MMYNEEDDDDFSSFKEPRNIVTTTSFGSESVPEEQRPTNEYLNLIQQPLFDWANQESGTVGLATKLVITYIAIFILVCYPIAGATFTTDTFLIPKIASANVGAMGFLLALLLRLYSGWGFVGSRLQSPMIEYEETGWYDGTMEQKTKAERARDLFLYRKEVQPVVDRLKSTTLVVLALVLASCFVFQVSLSNQPMFDQYNPQVLKNLELDDTLAEKAAANSQGRPTYCDNRYYSAIANGGQGCK